MNAPSENRALSVPAAQPDQAVDLFTQKGFDLACRIAKAFAASDAVPAQFRALVEKKGKNGSTWTENPAAVGNCIVAIETARAVGMSITSVMQQAHVIEGKLTWSAQFVIGAINSSGRFTPLAFDFTPRGRIKAKYREKLGWNDAKRGFDFRDVEVEIEDMQCQAWAYAKDRGVVTTRKVVGPPVSMKMAVEEGWYGKPGSKWQGEMAQLMLTYRAGSFFGRIHAPDIVMGMGQTTEEVRDTIDITPPPEAVIADAPATQPPTKPAATVVERVEPEDATEELPFSDEPPVKAAETPPEKPEPAAQEPAAQEPQTAAGPLSPPASVGEKQNLRARASDAGLPMQMVLNTIGAGAVDPETLDGLTKAQFKAAKGVVG